MREIRDMDMENNFGGPFSDEFFDRWVKLTGLIREGMTHAEAVAKMAYDDSLNLNLEFIEQDDDFVDDTKNLDEWLEQLYLRADELKGVFIGVGNTIGSALAQAITGTRSFADAIKQTLLGAVAALIGKLTALTVAYGLAAIAKALFDGGTSISSAATAITKSGFGSFLTGNLGLGNLGAQTINVKTTGFVAGSDLVLTTGRGLNVNDRLYG